MHVDVVEWFAVGVLRLNPVVRGMASESNVDIFTFYGPTLQGYGEKSLKSMKYGVNDTPLNTVNHTGYTYHTDLLHPIHTDNNNIPKHHSQYFFVQMNVVQDTRVDIADRAIHI